MCGVEIRADSGLAGREREFVRVGGLTPHFVEHNLAALPGACCECRKVFRYCFTAFSTLHHSTKYIYAHILGLSPVNQGKDLIVLRPFLHYSSSRSHATSTSILTTFNTQEKKIFCWIFFSNQLNSDTDTIHEHQDQIVWCIYTSINALLQKNKPVVCYNFKFQTYRSETENFGWLEIGVSERTSSQKTLVASNLTFSFFSSQLLSTQRNKS